MVILYLIFHGSAIVSTLHDCWIFVVRLKVESPPTLFFLKIFLAMLGLIAYLDIILGLVSFYRKTTQISLNFVLNLLFKMEILSS